jgi:peptidoglycan/xylan/chitin deacetylase (PgdA/CDA1 family)
MWGAAAVALLGAHAGVGLTGIGPLRSTLTPTLSGIGRSGHVALTFDDGPDPAYTPAVLDTLDSLGVHATFFCLGSMAAAHPELAGDLIASGHEVGVHGYDHRLALRRGPRASLIDLTRARDVVEAATKTPVRWWRPPYGVLTGGGLLAARRLRLRPVLWTAWARDWTSTATATSVLQTVRRGLRPGATVLLHDSDCTSADGSSAATLAALPDLVRYIRSQGFEVGPLREHGIPGYSSW